MRNGRIAFPHSALPTVTLPRALAVITFTVSGLWACSTQEPAPPAPDMVTHAAPEETAVATPAAPVATAVADAATDFAGCVSRLQASALDNGISTPTIDNVLGEVRYVARVIELDRKQPEYSETFRNYLTGRVTTKRIEQGRSLLAKHGVLLGQIEQQYGVPPQYLLAFWGLETNFGSYLGNMPVLDSLATLACDQRRSEFFTRELFEALKLVDEGIVAPPAFTGSWAGAVGNTQFMPSTYRRYAVDGDGNGRPDLWRSVPDALTSAANYLAKIGWKADERWGREVTLPAGFDYSQANLQHRKPLREWAALGVAQANGQPLPAREMPAAILVPSGHKGPAFMAYHNFDVIMKWNRSEFYAISVGHLADRIKGEGGLQRTPPVMPRLAVAQVRQLQEALNTAGFDAGTPDGVLGSGTRKALRAWQAAQGVIADGYPSPDVLKALGVN